MIFASRLVLTSLAVALSLGIAGACYDLTPVPPTDQDAGAPCSPYLAPDACATVPPPDGGDIDADDTDADATDGGTSAEEPNP